MDDFFFHTGCKLIPEIYHLSKKESEIFYIKKIRAVKNDSPVKLTLLNYCLFDEKRVQTATQYWLFNLPIIKGKKLQLFHQRVR